MNKQHILGFFDDLVRTPVFLFLCAMFLCGAAAGGLTVRAHLGAAAARVRLSAPERAAAECGCRSTRLRACHDRRG